MHTEICLYLKWNVLSFSIFSQFIVRIAFDHFFVDVGAFFAFHFIYLFIYSLFLVEV